MSTIIVLLRMVIERWCCVVYVYGHLTFCKESKSHTMLQDLCAALTMHPGVAFQSLTCSTNYKTSIVMVSFTRATAISNKTMPMFYDKINCILYYISLYCLIIFCNLCNLNQIQYVFESIFITFSFHVSLLTRKFN